MYARSCNTFAKIATLSWKLLGEMHLSLVSHCFSIIIHHYRRQRMKNREKTSSLPSLLHNVVSIQALFRGWSTRNLVSVAYNHFLDNSSQIELMIQTGYQEYEYRHKKLTGSKLVCSTTHGRLVDDFL